MRTRTLLLLSVGTALLILVAGGVLLFQLSNQETTTVATPIGEQVAVGDASITVVDVDETGGLLRVIIEIGGVDDPDGIDNFRLVTGDRRLAPLAAPEDGRCGALTVEPQQCAIDFDVSASAGTSRVLVARRGEEQATWRLS